MIEFIFGHGRSKKTEYILQIMNKAMETGREVTLIAPEQQALLWDSVVASSLPASAAFQIETLSFTRLADSIFRRCGGVAKRYITDPKKALVMWNALRSVRESLLVYGKGREDRYIPLLLKAVSEAKLYSQTPASIMKAYEVLSAEGREESIALKLHDLSVIWAAYDAMLKEKYDDPEEISDALCDTLDVSNCFENKWVIIDSFYTLTPKEKNIVRRIFRDAENTFVTFPIKADDRDAIHTEHIRDFKNSLALSAGRDALDIRSVSLEDEEISPSLTYLRENLWKYTASPFDGESDDIRLYTCGDRHDEAAVCAARIWELVHQGASFSEIAVICADPEKLRGIIDTQLEALCIPVYMAEKNSLATEGAVHLIISAIRTAAYGWKREDLISCAKTDLTGLTPQLSDALEKYADKWRLRGKRAFCCDGWNMNPDGYTDSFSDWGTELLALANEARDILVPPIEELSYHLNGTVAEAASAVYKMLCDFNVYEKIKNESAELRRKGKGAEAQTKEQVWAAVCDILDTLVEISGDTTTNAVRFANLIEKTAQSIEIGTIPDAIDRVTVMGAGGARLDGVRHMIILGAVEGEFPATPGDKGFFTQRDKEVLSPMGITLSPGMDHRRSEELFRFYAAATAPSLSLSVIIPTENGKRASTGALRLMKLFPNSPIFENAHLDYGFLLQNKAAALYFMPQLKGTPWEKVVRSLLQCEDNSHSVCDTENDHVSSQLADSIFGERLVLSQTRLESFKDCPQSYYLKYVLSLDDGEEVKIAPSDVGNFVHKILENFLGEAKAQGLSYPLPAEWINETAQRLISEYITTVVPENSGKRLDYLFARISRSLMLYINSLSEEFAVSSFEPYGFETKVGFGGNLPPLEIGLEDGSTMSMVGIIDRLDVYRGENNVYVRVADYKTGSKNFHLKEALEGRNVQLLLYLFSVCGCPDCDFRRELAPNGEKLVPAGAVYFSARAGDASAANPLNAEDAAEYAASKISRTGIVLHDPAIILAMDPSGTGKYAPASFNKDGSISKRSVTANDEEMELIRETLCGAIAKTGEEMKKGIACATPDRTVERDVCEYCKMRPVCRREEN